MAPSSPAWLSTRKDRRKRNQPPPAPPSPPAATPASTTAAAITTPATKPRRAPPNPGGNPSGPQASVAVGRLTASLPVEADLEALADRFVAIAGRPEIAQALRPDLPRILAAAIRTAQLPGPMGMGERATLYRLSGIRMDDRGGTGGKADEAGRLERIAARLERSVGMRAKVVEAVAGREDDTGGAPMAAEPAGNLRFDD